MTTEGIGGTSAQERSTEGRCGYKNSNLLLGGAIIIKDILGLCVALYSVAGNTRWSWIKQTDQQLVHFTKLNLTKTRRTGMELTPRKETMYSVSDFLLISSSNVLNLINAKTSFSYITTNFLKWKEKHGTNIQSSFFCLGHFTYCWTTNGFAFTPLAFQPCILSYNIAL